MTPTALMKAQRCKIMVNVFVLYIVVLNMVITTAAVTTNNRILLSSVLVGAALAGSVSGSYEFGYTDLALLSTAVLVINFPRNKQATQDTCTAPGYTADPLLGCYRIIRSDTKVTKDQARQRCASDGGRLILINSEAEANELRAKLFEGVTLSSSILDTFIQGKRQDSSSPWVADDGRPLPYLPPVMTGDAASTSIVFYATKSTFEYYAAKPNFLSNTIVCEILTQ